jgi:hypothetical protein
MWPARRVFGGRPCIHGMGPIHSIAQIPEFPEVEAQINAAIGEYGAVFPKLNWSAPRVCGIGCMPIGRPSRTCMYALFRIGPGRNVDVCVGDAQVHHTGGRVSVPQELRLCGARPRDGVCNEARTMRQCYAGPSQMCCPLVWV